MKSESHAIYMYDSKLLQLPGSCEVLILTGLGALFLANRFRVESRDGTRAKEWL
jgi:hypothetical protein